MKRWGVVIPTRNREDSLRKVLTLLNRQSHEGVDLSIIVVVDGSTDGTSEMLRKEFPSAAVIEGDGNWWWSRSVNEGCKRALDKGTEADAVLLLNDDVEFPDDYIRHLMDANKKEPGAVIGSLNLTHETGAGALTRIFFSGVKRFRWWLGKIERAHGFLTPYERAMPGLYPSVVLPGRGSLVPSRVFKAIGFFDERKLPQYKADYDFFLRVNKHRIPVYICGDSIIYVKVESTGGGAPFVKQRFLTFFSSLFKTNTRTNLAQNLIFYARHYPRWALPLLPLTGFMVLTRQIVRFFTEKKY